MGQKKEMTGEGKDRKREVNGREERKGDKNERIQLNPLVIFVSPKTRWN